LTATTWKSADLRELIRDQLLHGAIDETRITARGPPLRLEPQMTLHMALMLHELGTNAVKYGALSNPGGSVNIGWTAENQMLCLRWEERGGPPASVPTRHGFGTTLIEQSATGQGGSARMLVEAEGISWVIMLPLPLPHPIGADGARQFAPQVVSSGAGRQRLQMAEKTTGKLAGARFLVVEDEPLVALDLAGGLREAGAEVVASTGSSKQALDIIKSHELDAALLDGNLNGRPVDEIAAALTRHNIPFMFVTGYGRDSLPQAFRAAPVLAKPFHQQQMLDAAAHLLERRGQVPRLRER
jgi:CheY-like chemotaxis protein